MSIIENIKNIHIVGIGGISNSAIAELLISKGYKVTGSDCTSSPITNKLEKIGAKIYIGHNKDNIKSADLVAYTAALTPDNPELIEAAARSIPIMSRAALLNLIMCGYKRSIAVSGTHGKTSTTAMIAHLLAKRVGATAMVGGILPEYNSNLIIGDSVAGLFITEACEYKDSFHDLYPTIAVILNVDEDHLDYFKNMEGVLTSFKKYTENVKKTLIYNADDYNTNQAVKDFRGRVVSFGERENADYVIKNIVYDDLARPTFDIYVKGEIYQKVSLSSTGHHNVLNATAAFAAAEQILEDPEFLAERLSTFKNANRRFENYGELCGIKMIDDYAHHPSEIKAVIKAANRIVDKARIIAIFQPHTYSRTKELLESFGSAFVGVDKLIVSDIYAAREADKGEVSSKDVVAVAKLYGVDAEYGGSVERSADLAYGMARQGDLVITLGAGDIDRAIRMVKKRLGDEAK